MKVVCRCAINGDFENNSGGAMAYCWFVWEKGFKGKTTIEWFNQGRLVVLPTTFSGLAKWLNMKLNLIIKNEC